jgi:hypothetical protein
MTRAPPKVIDPMQYASVYTLDLYCDRQICPMDSWHSFHEFPHQFTGDTFAECARIARKLGWKIHHRTRTATCPKCARAE